jgi:hypothetical protein
MVLLKRTIFVCAVISSTMTWLSDLVLAQTVAPEVRGEGDKISLARQAFDEMRFDEARNLFDELSRQDRWSFVGFYNLGSVASRQQRYGEALAYYRRALDLSPRDDDTRFNFELMKKRLNILPGQAPLPSAIPMTLNETLLVLWLSTSLLLVGIYKFLRKRKLTEPVEVPWFLISSGAVFVVAVFLTGWRVIDLKTSRAIITVSKVDLRSGPSETNATIAATTEGAEVRTMAKMSDWTQIALSDGMVGWVPNSALLSTEISILL